MNYLYTNKTEIVPLDNKLPDAGYDIVDNFSDLNGKNWLLYNSKQAAFYNANPGASPEEVYNMQLTIIEEYVPTRKEMVKLLQGRINERVNTEILSGFVWQEMEVWLSIENQSNYKAAYDLNYQAQAMQKPFTPVKFKFGTDEKPIYYTFTSFDDLADFFLSAFAYIQSCYQSGWEEKEALSVLSDDELRNLIKE